MQVCLDCLTFQLELLRLYKRAKYFCPYLPWSSNCYLEVQMMTIAMICVIKIIHSSLGVPWSRSTSNFFTLVSFLGFELSIYTLILVLSTKLLLILNCLGYHHGVTLVNEHATVLPSNEPVLTIFLPTSHFDVRKRDCWRPTGWAVETANMCQHP